MLRKGHKIALITAASLFASTVSLLSIGFASWGITDNGHNTSLNGDVGADDFDETTKGIEVDFYSVFTMGTYSFVGSNGNAMSSGQVCFKMTINYSIINDSIKTNSGFVLKIKISFGDELKEIFSDSCYSGMTTAPTDDHIFICNSTETTPQNTNTYREYQLSITKESTEGIVSFTFNQSLFVYRDYILNSVFNFTYEGVIQ